MFLTSSWGVVEVLRLSLLWAWSLSLLSCGGSWVLEPASSDLDRFDERLRNPGRVNMSTRDKLDLRGDECSSENRRRRLGMGGVRYMTRTLAAMVAALFWFSQIQSVQSSGRWSALNTRSHQSGYLFFTRPRNLEQAKTDNFSSCKLLRCHFPHCRLK